MSQGKTSHSHQWHRGLGHQHIAWIRNMGLCKFALGISSISFHLVGRKSPTHSEGFQETWKEGITQNGKCQSVGWRLDISVPMKKKQRNWPTDGWTWSVMQPCEWNLCQKKSWQTTCIYLDQPRKLFESTLENSAHSYLAVFLSLLLYQIFSTEFQWTHHYQEDNLLYMSKHRGETPLAHAQKCLAPVVCTLTKDSWTSRLCLWDSVAIRVIFWVGQGKISFRTWKTLVLSFVCLWRMIGDMAFKESSWHPHRNLLGFRKIKHRWKWYRGSI